MKHSFLVIVCFVALLDVSYSDDKSDKDKSFCEMVISRNLRCESHEIVTSDGYILVLFRIPGAFNEHVQNGKEVVFLQHGVIDSSDTWIYNTEQNAIGTWLAQQGYDVWFGNSRGNKYSKKHKSLPSNW